AVEVQVVVQRGATEGTRCRLADDDLTLLRCDLFGDVVARVDVLRRTSRPRTGPVPLPPRDAHVLEFGDVNNRYAHTARHVEQRRRAVDRVPAVLAAGLVPRLDRLEDRLSRTTERQVVVVDHDDGRLAAEPERLRLRPSGLL